MQNSITIGWHKSLVEIAQALVDEISDDNGEPHNKKLRREAAKANSKTGERKEKEKTQTVVLAHNALLQSKEA